MLLVCISILLTKRIHSWNTIMNSFGSREVHDNQFWKIIHRCKPRTDWNPKDVKSIRHSTPILLLSYSSTTPDPHLRKWAIFPEMSTSINILSNNLTTSRLSVQYFHPKLCKFSIRSSNMPHPQTWRHAWSESRVTNSPTKCCQLPIISTSKSINHNDSQDRTKIWPISPTSPNSINKNRKLLRQRQTSTRVILFELKLNNCERCNKNLQRSRC